MHLNQARQFIAKTHPNEVVSWIDKGQMNDITIVGDQFVYKFPKKPEYFRLLQKEFEIYSLLSPALSIQIPRPVVLDSDNHYLQITFVSGNTLHETRVTNLNMEEKANLATKVAAFIREMNSEHVKTSFSALAANDHNDLLYIENWLKKVAAHCTANPSELSESYLSTYQKFCEELPRGFCTGKLLTHRDLHEDNMLFDDSNHLTGIIDFADMRYASIYDELRTVIRFGEDVAEDIITQLHDLAEGATVQQIKLYAVTYEMAVLYQDKYIQKELPWRVNKAKHYLRFWGWAGQPFRSGLESHNSSVAPIN